ncbi:MAG: ROK family transcriptional regulator [Spirochaetaceae bacterium]|nr:MAG: ROK family transcriptional regulator [Spirochaetaceae bacterium]
MVNYVSKVNITRVLRTIYLKQGLSRVEISKILDLNKSTVSKIVSLLEEIGIVETAAVGDAGPTGGRRPLQLRICSNWGCIMGVEIQTEAFTVVGINLQGDVFFSHTEALDLRKTSLVDAFADIVRRFRPGLEATGMPLLGIGVGLPGFVDPLRGVLRASMPFEHFEEIAFVRESRAKLGFSLPILVDNDANCGCWGELAFRYSERTRNFVFVLGELRKHTIAMDDYRIMALGLGLVLNGHVHHGDDYSAGEFRSILYKSHQVNQFSVTDEQARQFLQNPEVDGLIVEELSRHLAFLINVLNLRKVVIGGQMEILTEDISTAVRGFVRTNWAYPEEVNCEIEVSRLGEQAVAYGAAGMYLEHLIEIPDVNGRTRQGMPCGIDLLPPKYRETADM